MEMPTAQAAPEPKWDLLLLLPNLAVPPQRDRLRVRAPSPFASKWVTICAGDDPLLERLEENPANRTMRQLAGQFTSIYGNYPYRPSSLLRRTDAPDSVRTADALTAFRNACCAAVITYSPSFAIKGETWRWEQAHSDHFLFCPETPGADGALLKTGTIVTGWTDEIDSFHGHPSYLIERPECFNLSVDEVLLGRLLGVWQSFYIDGADSHPARRLFRALQVAFHAGRHPSVSLNVSVNDVGTRIALWISAFEVLFHEEGKEKVFKSDVLTAIARTEWTEDSPLYEKPFTVRVGQEIPATFAEKIYDELHEARNDFMHGNPVSFDTLKLNCSPSHPPLAVFGPVLFNLALRSFLAAEFPREASEDEQRLDDFFGLSDIEEAFLRAMRGGEEPAAKGAH